MLTVYRPSGLADIGLLRVYEQMLVAGDFTKGFGLEFSFLSGFFGQCQAPTTVLLGQDDPRVSPWAVFWLTPTDKTLALWIAPGVRQTRRALAAVHEAIAYAFETLDFRVLLVATIQTRLLKMYRSFGFTAVGQIHDLHPDGETHLWQLTRATYEQRRVVPAVGMAS